MSRPTIRIEPKHEDDAQAARGLRTVLLERRLMEVTSAEAAAVSGLPLERCTGALFVLARRYHARLQVDEAGVIRFRFPGLRAPAARRAHRLKAWWRRHRQTALAMGTALLAPPVLLGIAGNALAVYDAAGQGVAIAFPVVAGACLFAGLAAALALVVAAYSARVFIAEALLFGLVLGNLKLWLGLAAVILGYRALVLAGASLGRWANPLRAEESDAHALAPSAFTAAVRASVRGFLFGPTAADALADERTLTAFIVERAGVVTPGDLMGLMGWDADQVGEQLPRLLMDYGGELLVTEAGGLVCRFDPLSAAPKARAPRATKLGRELLSLGLDPAAMGFDAAKVWDLPSKPLLEADTRPFGERVGPPRLWGTSRAAVAGMLLAMGVGLAGLYLDPVLTWFPGPGTWVSEATEDRMRPFLQGFGIYPYLLALLPTVIRGPSWLPRARTYREETAFREMLRIASCQPEGCLVANPDTAALARLQGDIDVERGHGQQVWVHFPRLASAAAEAARLREASRVVEAAIVYDTHSDDVIT